MTITANTIWQLLEHDAWDNTNAVIEQLIEQWRKKLSLFDVNVNNQVKITKFEIAIPLGKTEYLPYQKHIKLLKKYAKELSTFFRGLEVELEIRNKNVFPPVVTRVYYEDRLDASIWREWDNPLQWCVLVVELNYVYDLNTGESKVELSIPLRTDLFLRHMERSLMSHAIDSVTTKTANDIVSKYYDVMMNLLERLVKAIRLISVNQSNK